MSSKINSKTSKKDRPRSSDRLKGKKRDATPEKSSTPSQDLYDENRPPSLNAIWSDEIEKLIIKPDDMQLLYEPRPPTAERNTLTPITQTVGVRKFRKVAEVEKPTAISVTVAKPAPQDAELKAEDYSGYSGPRYNHNGDVLSHSILGSFDDFHTEAVKRGDFINVETPKVDLDQSNKMTLKYEKKRPRSHLIRKQADENNALVNWQLKMRERKKQQGYISKLLQVPPEDLVMNHADNFRKMQETQEIIDKTIPAVDYGKGYRVGSEFWNQQKLMGDEVHGIHMSLNETQKGNGPDLQRIGVPETIRHEKVKLFPNYSWTWAEDHRTEVHYPWHKTAYLASRLKQLQPLINELDPHKPKFDGLEVIGTNRPVEAPDNEMETDASLSELQLTNEDLLSKHPDVYPTPIFGPSIQFAGQPARWTGDSSSFKEEVGIETRVTFESYTNERITSYLEIINDGTTAVYYDWKKLANDNPFELVKTYVHRFYFNNSNGVILPGETMKFPFVFKSPNAGVFTEQWLFETRPTVCGGAALVVTLRGVAVQEDVYKNHREVIEQELGKKQANQVVSNILYELIDGIKTPERARSPIDAYITQEETFTRLNDGMCYKHEQVEELKRIYLQLFTLEERDKQSWDLSVNNLKQKILQLPEDDELKEPMLNQVNIAVQKMSYILSNPVREEMEKATYKQLAQALDNICGYSIYLRNTIGLPEKRFEEAAEEPIEIEEVEPVLSKKKGKVKSGVRSLPETEPLQQSKNFRKSGRRFSGVVRVVKKALLIKKLKISSVPEGKASRNSDKNKLDTKQEKKPSPSKDPKVLKSGKETPKGPESKGKIIPAPKKPPSRAGMVTPVGEMSLSANNSPSPSPTPTAEYILDRKYREKLYTMTYLILGDMASNIEGICEDVKCQYMM